MRWKKRLDQACTVIIPTLVGFFVAGALTNDLVGSFLVATLCLWAFTSRLRGGNSAYTSDSRSDA